MVAGEFVVSFREFFEIAILLGALIAIMKENALVKLAPCVLAGAIVALGTSVAMAAAMAYAQLEFGAYEAFFEGLLLLAASASVTMIIVSMAKGNSEFLKESKNALSGGKLAIFIFSFTTVLREGAELVLFLSGIRTASNGLDIAYVAAGALAAIALAAIVLGNMVSFDSKRFFRWSAILLILIAGGLLSQGVHELEEAGAVPALAPHFYGLNPQAPENGPYPLLHEKGIAGSTIKTLVGLDFSPSLSQLVLHMAYLAWAFWAIAVPDKHTVAASPKIAGKKGEKNCYFFLGEP